MSDVFADLIADEHRRNVICSSIPTMSKLHAQVYKFSKEVSEHLIPRTTAYHEIWLDKKLVAGEALKDFEPLYGEFYLPRKVRLKICVSLLVFLLISDRFSSRSPLLCLLLMTLTFSLMILASLLSLERMENYRVST